MNIAELATNIARDIGAVRQSSCKRVDGVEYHFEQSELEQFAKELIADFIYKFKRHVGGDGEFWLHELEDFAELGD